MSSTARAREHRSRSDGGAVQLYRRAGLRPWLLELAALADDPAEPSWR